MAAKQEGSTTLFEAQLVPLPSVLQQRQIYSFPSFTSSLQPETLPALLVDVEDPGLDLGHYLLEVVPQAVDAAPGMTDLHMQLMYVHSKHKYYALYLPDRRQYHSVGSPRSLRVPRPYPRHYSSGYPSAP